MACLTDTLLTVITSTDAGLRTQILKDGAQCDVTQNRVRLEWILPSRPQRSRAEVLKCTV